MRDDLWDSDTYRLWHDRLGHPGHDMMIRILKTSHGHPFFRTKRSKNQKLVRGDAPAPHGAKTVQDRPLRAGTVYPLRQQHGIDAMDHCLTPPSTSKVNCDFVAKPKSSLVVSKAHHSFCKACSLAKLGSRPSYAKDTKENIPFLHTIQGDYVDRFNQLADYLDVL